RKSLSSSLNAETCAFKHFGTRLFGDNSRCATPQNVVDETMSVNGRSFDRDEDRSFANLPRIVRYIGSKGCRVARKFRRESVREGFDGYGRLCHSLLDLVLRNTSDYTLSSENTTNIDFQFFVSNLRARRQRYMNIIKVI